MRCSPCPSVALRHCHIHLSTVGVEYPTTCSPILSQRCFQAFNFQIISFVFQPCLPGTTPRVTTSYNCLVHLSWLSVWIHALKMTVPTKTPPNRLLSSSDGILPVSVVEQTHLIIIILRLRWETFPVLQPTFHWHAIRYYAHMHCRRNRVFSGKDHGKRELAKAH